MTLLACCLENLDAELTQAAVVDFKLISLRHKNYLLHKCSVCFECSRSRLFHQGPAQITNCIIMLQHYISTVRLLHVHYMPSRNWLMFCQGSLIQQLQLFLAEVGWCH